MKLSFWDRVLMFLQVLLSALLLLATALRPLGLDAVGDMLARLEMATGKFAYLLIVYGLAAMLLLLDVYMLTMIFRRGEKGRVRNTISVDSGDGGRVSISMAALEQMARQAIGHVDGINDMKIRISGDDDAISVGVELSVNSDAHVPSVTMNMQRTIRQHIEENCGVAVRKVDINVGTFTDGTEPVRPDSRHRIRRGRVEGKVAAAPEPTHPAPEPGMSDPAAPEANLAAPEANLAAPEANPEAPEANPEVPVAMDGRETPPEASEEDFAVSPQELDQELFPDAFSYEEDAQKPDAEADDGQPDA